VVTLGASEVPPELPEKVSDKFLINVPMWVTSGGGGAPTVTTLRDALLNELKKLYTKSVDVPGVTESYDWSYDVTQTVVNSGLITEPFTNAYMYGWHKIISYTYAGPNKPTPRSDVDKVSNWISGHEKALLYIGKDTYTLADGNYGWYWVDVPARLTITKGGEVVPVYKQGIGPLLLFGGVAALMLLSRKD